MRTLVYGAGPLGSLYAARLQQAGVQVALLARGQRLADLREHGVVLEDAFSGQRETHRCSVAGSHARQERADPPGHGRLVGDPHPGDHGLLRVVRRRDRPGALRPTPDARLLGVRARTEALRAQQASGTPIGPAIAACLALDPRTRSVGHLRAMPGTAFFEVASPGTAGWPVTRSPTCSRSTGCESPPEGCRPLYRRGDGSHQRGHGPAFRG